MVGVVERTPRSLHLRPLLSAIQHAWPCPPADGWRVLGVVRCEMRFVYTNPVRPTTKVGRERKHYLFLELHCIVKELSPQWWRVHGKGGL